MLELLGKTGIDFIGKRRIAFVASGLLVSLGLLAVVQMIRGRANLGIDFTGGTVLQVRFERPAETSEVRRALDAGGFRENEIQSLVGGNRMLLRIRRSELATGMVSDRVTAVLAAAFPANPFTVERTEEVGPVVGKTLQGQALSAVFFSMIGITLYIAWRFEFRFGVAAALATVHDVLVVMGVFLLLNKEFTLLIVTALLTLAGYSLTDTVVVFDRIRENLRLRRKDSLPTVINLSVNEVLSRTIITSTTVFLVLLALFFMGGEVIHDFSFALLIGVVVGTYSSVFVASPILVEWKHYQERRSLRLAQARAGR